MSETYNRKQALYKYFTDLVTNLKPGFEVETGQHRTIDIFRGRPDKPVTEHEIMPPDRGYYICNIASEKPVETGANFIKESGDEFDSIMSELRQATEQRFNITGGGTLEITGLHFTDFYEASSKNNTLFLIELHLFYIFKE